MNLFSKMCMYDTGQDLFLSLQNIRRQHAHHQPSTSEVSPSCCSLPLKLHNFVHVPPSCGTFTIPLNPGFKTFGDQETVSSPNGLKTTGSPDRSLYEKYGTLIPFFYRYLIMFDDVILHHTRGDVRDRILFVYWINKKWKLSFYIYMRVEATKFNYVWSETWSCY